MEYVFTYYSFMSMIDARSLLKQCTDSLNSELSFSYCYQAKEPRLSYNLPKDEGKEITYSTFSKERKKDDLYFKTEYNWFEFSGGVLYTTLNCIYPAGWSCRIHRQFFCKGIRLPLNECPWYDSKQSVGVVPIMLELWGMRSTTSLPSHPGSLWPEVVAPDGVLSMCQIELNSVFMLKWIVWNKNVLIFKLTLNWNKTFYIWTVFWHWNCVLMLNWVFEIELFIYIYKWIWH